jgi:hypothetical protein
MPPVVLLKYDFQREQKKNPILTSLRRADQLIDNLTRESIMRESKARRSRDQKNTYVIKGGGYGKGMGMSHPLMDYKSMNKKQI